MFVGIKNIILWSYERGTWQYDVLCLLIIGTIFLVPSRYFGDRDRASVQTVRTNNIGVIASESGETVREVAVSDLKVFLDEQNKPELMLRPQEALSLYLHDKLKQDLTVIKVEPYMNSLKGEAGYKVWTR